MLTGVTRQKILITGASSGLGAGMARSFAAQGRDLALCARRTDRLTELKAELSLSRSWTSTTTSGCPRYSPNSAMRLAALTV